MTDAERLALSNLLRAVGDMFGACEAATRALSACGQTEAARDLAVSSIAVTEQIVVAMAALAISPAMLVARMPGTDASTN